MHTVKVSRECIEQGERGKSMACPIAIAILKDLRSGWIVKVGSKSVGVLLKCQDGTIIDRCSMDLPWVGREFVQDFDKAEDSAMVDPVEFEIRLPEECLRSQ